MTNIFMDLGVPLNNFGQQFDRHSSSGTEDDDDDRDDEHARENEAPVREIGEDTEVPEEFEPEAVDEPERAEVADDFDDDDDKVKHDDDLELSALPDRGALRVSLALNDETILQR
jgi:hypothetical protein